MKKVLFSASFITILVMGMRFLFKIYLSYKISQEVLGIFYTFMDLISIGIMLFAGFRDSLIKAYDEGEFEKILYWYIFMFWGLFGIVLIIEVIYYKIVGFKYSLIYLILLFTVNSLMVFLSYLNAAFKVYKVMLFENLVMTISLFIGFIITNSLVFAFLFSFLGRIIWILMFSKIKPLIKKSNFYEVRSFLKNTLLSSLMYFFSSLFVSLSGLLILKLFNDSVVLGEYQVVVRSVFFSLVAVFVYPLNTFLFPEISKFISQRNFFEVKRMENRLVKYLILMFIILSISTFFTKFAIAIVFPREYIPSYKMLNVILPSLPFVAYTTFALNIIKGFNMFDLALFIRVIGCLVFFVSFYIFYILKFSASCVVYSLDLAFISMAFMGFHYKRRLLN